MAMSGLPSLGNQPSSMDVDINPDGGGQGFDEVFIPAPPDVYECPICLLVLNQPMQTVCGHRFCKGCILKVLREGRPNCPIDNEGLDENQIYPDNFARREISCLSVRCRNHKQHGCEWIGALKNLKAHLQSCEYGMIPCPNGCGQLLSRMETNEHVTEKCERRIVCCEYCDIKVVFKVFNEHRDRCIRFPVECPNACSTGRIPREELTRHLEENCPNTIYKCTYRELGCTFEGTRDDIRRHAEAAENTTHFEMLVNTIRSLKKSQDQQGQSLQRQAEIERLNSRILVLELALDNMKQHNADLDRKIDSLSQSIKDNEKMIQEVNARVWSGCIIWKITNFRELYQQAKSGETPALHSFPFYTGVPGYKMCIRVNLNGIDSGQHTHVSMFVHLMQGEFDSIIPWPFPGSIVLTIMDQDAPGEPQHVRETLTARPSLQAFLRPKLTRNQKGYGYVEMISHAMLENENRGYIKDDSLLVKVEVKVSTR